MPIFYGTFMQKQGTKNHYVKMYADDKEAASHTMHDHFGEKYGFIYDAEEFKDQIILHDLTRLMTVVVVNHAHLDVGWHPEYIIPRKGQEPDAQE